MNERILRHEPMRNPKRPHDVIAIDNPMPTVGATSASHTRALRNHVGSSDMNELTVTSLAPQPEEYNGASQMTDRQAFALSHVLADLKDLSVLKKHALNLARGSLRFGTILTVDKYRNDFSWHVAVSLLNRELKPIPIEQLSVIEKSATIDLARELLANIGRPDSDRVYEDEKSVHVLRSATIEEERQARKAIARKKSAK
jgi:hypothetical protein